MSEPADAAAIALQIGRYPRGEWSVARRCACGLPQVISTAPYLDDGTPFPTLWWLTCKRLVQAISGLESGGWMASFNERLARDPDLQESLRRCAEDYLARRDALGRLESRGHPGGGPTRVKCLHAHTAHHLITGDDPAGKQCLDELGWEDPATPCV